MKPGVEAWIAVMDHLPIDHRHPVVQQQHVLRTKVAVDERHAARRALLDQLLNVWRKVRVARGGGR